VREFRWRTVAVVLFVGAIGFYSLLWISGEQVASALIAVPLLLLLTMPLFMNAARNEARFDLGGLLAVGLILRFLASYYRFTNGADSILYHRNGVIIAQHLRQFDFGVDPGAAVPGTGGLRYIAGVVEVFTGSNQYATFLVFAWLGFIACYLFYRAFVTALPNADHHRYALLIFLWPSLLFWPSSIGKDCWMILTVGLAVLGASRVFMRLRGGYTLMLLGFAGGSLVRPHVMLIVLVGFIVALAIGRRVAKPGVTPSSVAKVAGLVLLIVVGTFLVGRTQSVVGGSGVADFDTVLTQTANQTQQGTSAFSPPNPRSPIGYPAAVVTVLIRPFLFEASGLEQIATSLEGAFLGLLILLSWRRLLTIPRRLRAEPFVTFALVYVGVFIFVFAAIANFGILARERSMLIPMVFVLLAVPKTLPAPKPPPKRMMQLPMRASKT
jgi:hypothetical protein